MRASYVNKREILTPIGEAIASRLPFVRVLKRKTHRGWRIFIGPRFWKCIVSLECTAHGFRLPYLPFKYVYWNISFYVLRWRVYQRKRLFHRHKSKPNFKPSTKHLFAVMVKQHKRNEEMNQNFPILRFRYTNHAGKTAVRNVVSPILFWGQSDFYPEPQWLLNAYDLDKQTWRTFAVVAMQILEQNSNSNCDSAAITTGVVE